MICGLQIKDEQFYLGEWLDWHSPIFDKIIVVEDIGSTSHADIVADYSNVEVRQMWRTSITRQIKTQQDIVNEINDWVIFLDVDEFLCGMIDTDFYKNEVGVIVPYHLFNANGHKTMQKNVVESYTREVEIADDYELPFKCFVNARLNPRLDLHRAVGSVWQDDVWINHYYTKSQEDWQRRIDRGGVMRKRRGWDEFYVYNPGMKEGRK